MKKTATRRLGINPKLLITVLIIVMILALGITYVSCRHLKKGMIKMGGITADMAANVAANTLDVDTLADALANDDEALYDQILSQLQAVMNICDLNNIYVLYNDEGTIRYLLNVATEKSIADTGTIFEGATENLTAVFSGEDYVQDFIDEDEVITAYKPLYTSSGNIIAIIGCDSDATIVNDRLQYSMKYIILVAFLDLLFAIALCEFSVRKITKGIRIVNEKIYELVHKEGDLTQTLHIKSGDELELIADNVNDLLAFIREIMTKISGNSLSLNDATIDISDKLSDAEHKVDEVSTMMQQMSASMQETSSTLNQIEESVSQIDSAMLKFSQKANDGNTLSQDIMTQSDVIYQNVLSEKTQAQTRVADMQQEMVDKIEQSKAVSEIALLTNEILDITDQTKLLALNASIEAARAGESGKGFAIVADEISKLAQNSASAAEQISTVSTNVVSSVNELAEKASQMVSFMDEVTMQGYDKLLQTSDYYTGNITKIHTMLNDFATESNQLRSTISVVNKAIDGISIAVEESTKDITNVAELSLSMSDGMTHMNEDAACNKEISEKLNAEVGRFKI
jgi:methyl-accepting chemotaxis protein